MPCHAMRFDVVQAAELFKRIEVHKSLRGRSADAIIAASLCADLTAFDSTERCAAVTHCAISSRADGPLAVERSDLAHRQSAYQ